MERLPGVGRTLDEREGIAIVMRIASRPLTRGGLQCAFRVINDLDYGIDAHLEFTIKTDKHLSATGRMLSLQIKSGPSYFENDIGNHWRIYIDKSTLNYWRQHSVPVLLVIVDNVSEKAFWVRGDDNHKETDKHYAIDVPKINEFNQSAWGALWAMASSSDAFSDFFVRGRFEMALPWLLSMNRGENIIVDVEDLCSESPNRKCITLRYRFSADELASSAYYSDQEALERTTVTEEYYTDVAISVRDLISLLFDWATAEPLFERDNYLLEFEDQCHQANEYDPPRDPEESGLYDFESWLHETYFDSDEEMFLRRLSTGRLGYTFTLMLNERGRRLIELLGEQ